MVMLTRTEILDIVDEFTNENWDIETFARRIETMARKLAFNDAANYLEQVSQESSILRHLAKEVRALQYGPGGNRCSSKS